MAALFHFSFTGSCLSRPALVLLMRHAHVFQFLYVILALEDVPLLAAFDDFFFLRADLLANAGIDFFLFTQVVLEDLDDVLTNGVAVLDELHVVAGNEKICNLVGDADDFFPTQSHSAWGPQMSGVEPAAMSLLARLGAKRRSYRRISFRSRASCPLTFLYISW